ncbi:flagellar basal body P-ring formation chaperone FlgA [Aliikangiella maris]|uniref:Flagellar basal body P-ring formation chaperone FlgA n=2 Tax=Aliikangiella maris TaxID=3162458 RepID=A0ABV2BZ96_9GAMM
MKLINNSNSTVCIKKGLIIKQLISTLYFCLLIFIPFMTNATSSNIQSIEEIQNAAKKFLEEMPLAADNPNVEIEVGAIDSRLRLVKCEQPLDIFLPQGVRHRGKTSVAVHCQSPVAWKIIIPATITQYQMAWVVTHRVSPGELLTMQDIQLQKVKTPHHQRQPLLNKDKILSANPRRMMRKGSIIYQDSLCLVCRGETVSVSADNEFFSISVEGVALSDAILGETAQIRNAKSMQTFSAQVTGKNQLSVNITGSN